MNFPRIKQFNFDTNSIYIIPHIYSGKPDKIAIDIYGSYKFYKPLCEANNIKLPYGLRSGLRPIEEQLRIELKNTIFTNFSVAYATDPNDPNNGNIPFPLSGLLTIDGNLLTTGDLILVKDQYNLDENGVYETSTDIWRKLTNITNNLLIIPTGGVNNKNKVFRLKIIKNQSNAMNPNVFVGPFSIFKNIIFTEEEIETAVDNYFTKKTIAELDWNHYGDMFNGYVSGLYEGRLLVVPTNESCIAWMKKFEKIIP